MISLIVLMNGGNCDHYILVSASRSGYELANVTSGANYLKFYHEVKTFKEAREHCREEGGDLVMDNRGRKWHERITSFLILEVNAGVGVWLGAYKVAGNWIWVDGKEIEFLSSAFISVRVKAEYSDIKRKKPGLCD